VAQWLRHCATNRKVAGSFPMVSLEFFVDIILLAGDSNGKRPLRTCSECSVPEPYRSPDWALVPAKTGPRAEY
jgi:hypothetical protein